MAIGDTAKDLQEPYGFSYSSVTSAFYVNQQRCVKSSKNVFTAGDGKEILDFEQSVLVQSLYKN